MYFLILVSSTYSVPNQNLSLSTIASLMAMMQSSGFVVKLVVEHFDAEVVEITETKN